MRKSGSSARPGGRRLLVAPLAAALALLAGALLARPEEPAETPPVALRQGLFLTPVETAGSGIAPEVQVRITVDERGRVRDPEVLSIKPSSELDELFREAAIETLARWRYAPATAGGAPVARTLEWTVQFLPKSKRPPEPSSDRDTVLEQETRLTRVYTLPPEKQADRLRNFASLAESHLDVSSRRRVETARFVVISDAERADTAETIAGNLEAVYGLLDATFRDDIEPRPAHYKTIVYLYSSQAAFGALERDLLGSEWFSGLYVPPGLLGFHLEVPSVDTLLATMIHESVHAYADQHIVRPGYAPAPWLSEGLAGYFARSEIRKGRLVPGSIREGKYVIDEVHGGAYRSTTASGWRLDEAKRAVRAGRAASVADLMAAGRESFYGEDIAMHYALSWLLVHYLRHGEPGWADEEFPAFLLYASEGYSAEDALAAVYGRSPAELEDAFRAYVGSL